MSSPSLPGHVTLWRIVVFAVLMLAAWELVPQAPRACGIDDNCPCCLDSRLCLPEIAQLISERALTLEVYYRHLPLFQTLAK